MMALPISANFAMIRGTSQVFTITLVSGGGSTPINLAGANANMIIGPYVALSNVPTVSGGLVIGPNTGTIQIVMSGQASSAMYSPQQYYIGLTLSTGQYLVIQNGSINFISPFNRASYPSRASSYSIGVQDVTIGITDFEDGFIPIAVPSPPILTTSGIYGDNQNG